MSAHGASGPRTRWSRLGHDVAANITARPWRAASTIVTTAVGGALLIASVGLSGSATAAVLDRLDAERLGRITIRTLDPAEAPMPDDAAARIERLAGVRAVGALSAPRDVELSRSVLADPFRDVVVSVPVVGATPGLFDAVRAAWAGGTGFDIGHDARRDRVAVLGARVAERLHIAGVGPPHHVFVDGSAFAVLGVADGFERETGLVDAVIVPLSTAADVLGSAGVATVVVDVDTRAIDVVAAQSNVALDPTDRSNLEVTVPADLSRLRSGVADDARRLLVVAAVVSFGLGAIVVWSSTVVAVSRRRRELGIRRALGATAAQISVMVLAECTVVGAVAGLVGTSVGLITVAVVTSTQSWSVTMPWWAVAVSPVATVVSTILAGAWPARRACRRSPAAALRD